MLHQFLIAHTDELIERARARVAARTVSMPTEAELRHGVPLFLSQVIDRLRLATTDTEEIEGAAARHGGELLALGLSVGQVVHGYGDVCQVVTGLANELGVLIPADEYQIFNRCIDDAVAYSVTEYQSQRDARITHREMERLGALAHELRNRLSSAMLSFKLLQEGAVGVGGRTGAVLGRSLYGMRDLINNALADVRIDRGIEQRQRLSVSELIGDAEIEATIQASKGGFRLAISPVAPDVHVEADEQILLAAIGNLLQNAFKFSRARGQVALRTIATSDRVRIEIEDECGGLPPGGAEDLFRAFSQRSENRTGLGLGLTITRKGVEAMGGKLSVRDLPGKGCVFTIDLPRLPAA